MRCSLISSDLDGTLLGKPDATLAFRRTWENIVPEDRPLLCYNSGRLLNDTLELIDRSDLPAPEYIICGVGTLIFDTSSRSVLKEFSETLAVGWDIVQVEQCLRGHPEIERQPQKYQNKFKSSWYYPDAAGEDIDNLHQELEDAGLKVNIIYTDNIDLEILPEYANKGNSLEWLMEQLDIPPEEVIVAGDSGNDSSMFLIEGVRGIIVENTQPELLEATVELNTFVSEKPYADGVLEGLKHFGVIETVADISGEEVRHKHYDPAIRYVLKSSAFKSLDRNQLDFIETAHEKAIDTLKKNITPLGFSACSIKDNSFSAADQNYQSVWGRDGAITIIGSLAVDELEIRECQRNTLITMLEHVSPTGLIPSNVRVADEMPDYSGVGGISSVDSGMWVIIAFYHYIRTARDYDFLRNWFDTLQLCMDRLAALDSNNDALLEIPEAGDWTDLFGRSYNVLYDEVLWYNCNICFGRMCELMGDYRKASDYLRWAQIIKETILKKFWPTIHADLISRSFADQQFSLGNTSYLLAEITPFGFDWRCDVYGNILAGLFNVLDLERTRIAFRFMWGVGVNEPFPVVNLYPPVNAGDPGWRNYYTVNLLNLPLHYHNGGIWPFIGAQWVRFISRLGLKELAQQELYKLAELNRLGINHEWEFNEWYHGKTGRPMGKAFQAWSAAGFIQAYDELQMDTLFDTSAEH
jgi:sucrose-6-phosphatase